MKMRFHRQVQSEKTMSNRTGQGKLVQFMSRRAPVVRLPPKSNFELLLVRGSQIAAMFVGLVTVVFALHAGEYILAPITSGIVVGLMLGPIATRLEMRGFPPALSALVVFLLFIVIVGLFTFVIASPLALWAERIPQIWAGLQKQLAELQQPLETIRAARDEIREITGGENLTVSVEDGSPVESVATLAPSLLAQILIFLASLYFFVATRHQTRVAVLKLCLTRRLRWRVAHIFRDVETLVSRYLLSVSVINVVAGIVVSAGLFAVGVQSAVLWGALAIVSNFIVFLGPLVMTVLLFAVGLTEFDTLGGALIPPLIYQAVNIVESQFVTPMVIGRTMTLNPFIVVLALIFWIWLWGPLGGFIAIPALLVVSAILVNTFPDIDLGERSRAS